MLLYSVLKTPQSTLHQCIDSQLLVIITNSFSDLDIKPMERGRISLKISRLQSIFENYKLAR